MKSFARHAQVAARILFGLFFVVRGLTGFLDLWAAASRSWPSASAGPLRCLGGVFGP